jgi:hypothetical protein
VREASTAVDTSEGNAAPGLRHTISRYGPAIAVAATFITLTIRLMQMVQRYSVNIFFSDHWKIEESTLFQHHSWLEIFRWQHGWPRQGLGGIVMWLFEPLTRWNMRADAYLAVFILALACAAALLLKRRLFGPITYADVAIPLLFFTPTQYENLIGPLNLAYAPFPTLLIVLFCLAWTITDDRWRCAALLVTQFFCTYTGFALLLGVLAPLLFGIEFLGARKWVPLTCMVASAVTLVSFGVGLQPFPASEVCHLVPQAASAYAMFLLRLFSQFVQAVRLRYILFFGITMLCSVLAMFSHSVLQLVRPGTQISRKYLVITALLGFALMFSAASAYSRSCGVAGAAPRYMTYLLLGFLGLYFGSISMRRSRLKAVSVGFVLAIGVLSSVWIGSPLQNAIEMMSQRQSKWRECYISTHDISACDARAGGFINMDPEPPDLRLKLDYLERNRLNLFR